MDREKVIEGLRCIKGDLILCVNCAYSDENGHGTHSCKAFCANDAIALLKEQEESKPIIRIIRKQCKIENSDGSIDYYAEWFCPHCKSLLQRGFDTPWIKYCYKCGKPITWGRSVKWE
jgi:hypothetical protein